MTKKKESCSCNSDKCTKCTYILLAVLFLLNIFTLVKVYSKGGNAVSNDDIAQWVDENPQAILDSVNKYAMAQQEEVMKAEQAKSAENLKKYKKELSNTKYAGVINPKGSIEIIEFYDYNCGYCKVASQNVDKLLETEDDVKVILRSIPILSESSVYASEIGMAIIMDNPEDYQAYHKALMKGSARTPQTIDAAVVDAGLNLNNIKKFLKDNKKEIEQAVSDNLELAQNIGVSGTPAFVINGELIPGAVGVEVLKEKVNN